MVIKFYTRVAAFDEWTFRTTTPEDFGEDVLFFVENGYYVKIEKHEFAEVE